MIEKLQCIHGHLFSCKICGQSLAKYLESVLPSDPNANGSWSTPLSHFVRMATEEMRERAARVVDGCDCGGASKRCSELLAADIRRLEVK